MENIQMKMLILVILAATLVDVVMELTPINVLLVMKELTYIKDLV
jgi:hypothetical protein